MVWQLGVVVVACGLVAKVLARLAIPPSSPLSDSSKLATSALVQVGVVILFGGSAVAILQDGADARHLVLGGFFAVVAIGALAMSVFLAWAALRLPSLRAEE